MKRVSYAEDLDRLLPATNSSSPAMTFPYSPPIYTPSNGIDKWQAGNMSEQEVRNNCVLNAKNVKITQKMEQ